MPFFSRMIFKRENEREAFWRLLVEVGFRVLANQPEVPYMAPLGRPNLLKA